MTLDQAKALKRGDILVDALNGARWKVNGKVKTWKRSPERVYVPLKHGLYRYAAMTDNDLHCLNPEDG